MPVDEFRLSQLERRVGKLESQVEDVNVLRSKLDDLKDDVHELTAKVNSINKALYTAALSVSGGCILLAFSILQVIK